MLHATIFYHGTKQMKEKLQHIDLITTFNLIILKKTFMASSKLPSINETYYIMVVMPMDKLREKQVNLQMKQHKENRRVFGLLAKDGHLPF